MLINPNKIQLETIPGTRILQEGFGLIGFQYLDPIEPKRTWVLQYLCAPIYKRRLNGIRAKFMDSKSFITFCNQRDLEVLLGIAQPGTTCYWADMDYAEIGEPDWFGLCVDPEDLEDDLLERELRLREVYPGVLPNNLEITRRIHSDKTDAEELHVLIADYDVDTGLAPDPRLETISRRWARVERVPIRWALTDI